MELVRRGTQADREVVLDCLWTALDAYPWPGTIYRETNNCCDTNGCCRSKPLKWFTIHGLWPQYNYGGWPSCCRPTRFNINKILMLIPILEKYWLSLYSGSSSTCFGGRGPFWVHEDEYDYSTALYLYSKYNVTKALRKAHLRPTGGRKYAIGHIVAVIEYAFGAMPSVVCKNGAVQELRLCFHRDYQPRDCTVETDTARNSRSYCPRYVTFPSYKPSGGQHSSKSSTIVDAKGRHRERDRARVAAMTQ